MQLSLVLGPTIYKDANKNARFDNHFFFGMLWFKEKSGGNGWGLQISGVGKILIALSPVYQLGDYKSINNSDNPVPLILNTP